MIGRRTTLAGLAALLALTLAAPAAAITPAISEFSGGLTPDDMPLGIAGGPDGNLWFTDSNSGGAIGRITTVGGITKISSGLAAGSAPFRIALGADGNLWFTDRGTTKAIGRIDTTGKIIEFTSGLNPAAVLGGITPGPDGDVWFADADAAAPALGRVTPSGDIHEFPLPAGSSPQGIATGSDGNLWFTDSGAPDAIGRMTPAGSVQKFTLGLPAGSAPGQITAGADGNVWFVDGGTHAIGRATPAGAITEFSTGLQAGARPVDISGGSDGAVWFTDQGGANPAIGRALPSGAIAEFGSGLNSGSSPSAIASGPDGNLWFTDVGATRAIGRITTQPAVTTVSAIATSGTTAAVLGLVDGHDQRTTFRVEYGTPGGSLSSTGGRSLGTVAGPTRGTAALSKLRPNTTYLARVVGTNDTDSVDGQFLSFKTGPAADRISSMRLRPKLFVAAAHGGPVRAARSSVGALITYAGSQPATTTFTISRATLGRRSGANCVKRTRRNARQRTCTLFVKVGSFKHNDVAGRVRFRLSGRLHNRTLSPGNYRLDAEPQGPGGIGHVVSKHFGVKPPPPKRHHHKKR